MLLHSNTEVDLMAEQLFHGQNNKGAFITGAIYAESSTIRKMFEFAEWCGNNYMRSSDIWIPESQFQNAHDLDRSTWKTTEELFEIWIKLKK